MLCESVGVIGLAISEEELSTPSVATLLVPPVSGGQLLAQCSVTDSTPKIGVVPRRGGGGG